MGLPKKKKCSKLALRRVKATQLAINLLSRRQQAGRDDLFNGICGLARTKQADREEKGEKAKKEGKSKRGKVCLAQT